MYRAYPPPPPPPPTSGISSPSEGLGLDKKELRLKEEKAQQYIQPPPMPPPTNQQSSTTSTLAPPFTKVSTYYSAQDVSIRRKTELQYLQNRAAASNAESLIARASIAATAKPTTSTPAIPSPPKTSSGSYLNNSTPNFISRSRPILGMDHPQSPSRSPPRLSNIPPPTMNATTTGTVQTSYGRTDEPTLPKNERLYNSTHVEPLIDPVSSRDLQKSPPDEAATSVNQTHTSSVLKPEDTPSMISDSVEFHGTKHTPIPSIPPAPPVAAPQRDGISFPPTTTSASSKRVALTSLWNVAPTPTSSVAEGDKDLNPPVNIKSREAISTIPEAIISTQSQAKESGTLRLVKELRKTKESLEEALKRESKLETQLMELKLKIIGSEQREREPRSIMNDDRNNSNRRRRMKSPEPSGRKKNLDPLSDVQIASKAVESVDNTFESSLAIYVVRKPYGGCDEMNYEFKDGEVSNGKGTSITWISSTLSYLQNASVREERTIEVAAQLKCDGSILIVHGSSCRHGTLSVTSNGDTDLEYKYFDNIEHMDGSMGTTLYIDSEGNECEYSLDPIYDEALTIRESYCSNVFSAAMALLESTSPRFAMQAGGDLIQPSLSSVQSFAIKPPLTDACVGTEDLLPPVEPVVSSLKDGSTMISSDPEPQPKITVTRSKEKKKKLEENFDSKGMGSTDALSLFILFFFSNMFSLAWFLLMIPIRISKFALSCMVILAVYQIAWIYIADDVHGAMIDSKYNHF